MIKAVIFDLDGLLIDSEPIAYGVLQDMIKPYGGFITLDDYINNYLGRTVKFSVDKITNDYNMPLSSEENLKEYFKFEEKRIDVGIPLKKGGIELLLYLKENGYKTIVASSSVRERAEKILSYHNISKYFDDLVFGYEVPRGKPYPDIFLKACEKLNVSPKEAIVLEDSGAGIKAGFDAGVPVICVPDLMVPPEEFASKASYIFPDLFKVIEFLEEQGE